MFQYTSFSQRGLCHKPELTLLSSPENLMFKCRLHSRHLSSSIYTNTSAFDCFGMAPPSLHRRRLVSAYFSTYGIHALKEAAAETYTREEAAEGGALG